MVIVMLLAGCGSVTPETKQYPVEVSNCDPEKRDDCWTIPVSTLRKMVQAMEENERIHAALNFCQKKL